MTKHILAVDDSKTIRDMVSYVLKKAGYDVTLANDGQQGLDALAQNRPDAIITDINMPVMDGLTFIRNIRADSHYMGIPILVLTTEASTELKQKGRDAGATGWIVKPFNPEKLLAVLQKVTA